MKAAGKSLLLVLMGITFLGCEKKVSKELLDAYNSGSQKAEAVYDEESGIKGAIDTYEKEFGNLPQSLKDLNKIDKNFTKSLEYPWNYSVQEDKIKLSLKGTEPKKENLENIVEIVSYKIRYGLNGRLCEENVPYMKLDLSKITDLRQAKYPFYDTDKYDSSWVYDNDRRNPVLNTSKWFDFEDAVKSEEGWFSIIPALSAAPGKINLEFYVAANKLFNSNVKSAELYFCEKSNNPNVKDRNAKEKNIIRDFEKIFEYEGNSIFMARIPLKINLDKESEFYVPRAAFYMDDKKVIIEGNDSTLSLWKLIRESGKYSEK